ncbi:MAG: penicillin-binding protein 2 [Kiritimatiellae bacterium]|nr:penicillin-binding protein 2 [Kiritimatiellia bacterium]
MTELKYQYRIFFVVLIVLGALNGLIARLVYLHFRFGEGEDRSMRIIDARRLETDLLVARGKIFDRRGNTMALDIVKKEICADPELVLSRDSVRSVAENVARTLNADPAHIRERLNQPGRHFVYLGGYGRPVEAEQALQLEKMKLPGVFLRDMMVRSYPRGSSMCHVLGFVNFDSERVGSAGIEQQWHKYLHGVHGLLISELDGRRHELYDRRLFELKPRAGADLTLTLDHYVQYVVEEALRKAVNENRASAGWAIVEEVKTGAILAMANYPDYDPNNFRNVSPEWMRNRCVGVNYEPGSTFKVAIIASALNENVVRSSQIFDCENGAWYYRKKPLRDFHPYGELSVADIIKKSSNIGAAKVALLLGEEKLFQYLRAFGLGRPTGIDLPGEESGILHPLSEWTPISITRVAIGHEIAVTSLQMLQVIAAIANEGVLMRPYVVRQIKSPEGQVLFEQRPKIAGRPIKAETAREMRRLLARVTEEGGTGRRAFVDGYSVAGKTGTAQKAVPGGYSDALNMASFAGFIPAEEPQLAIIVVLDEPRGTVHTGGAVAGPVFSEIAGQIVHYLDVPPSPEALAEGANQQAASAPRL